MDRQGEAKCIESDLVFDPADPYAVTIVFRTGAQEVRWTFARELLIAGRFTPTGDGDVHVWPCVNSDGRVVVIIRAVLPRRRAPGSGRLPQRGHLHREDAEIGP